MRADPHPHPMHDALVYACKLTSWYPTSVLWMTAMLVLIAVVAESQATLVGIIVLQLIIFGLLIHQTVMLRRRYEYRKR